MIRKSRIIVSVALAVGAVFALSACDSVNPALEQPDDDIHLPSDTTGVDQPGPPDGWIVYTAFFPGNDFRITVAKFSDPLTVTVISPQGAYYEPRYSPSGRWISFSSFSQNHSWIYDTESGGEATEIRIVTDGYRVAWARDESHFYYDEIGGTGDQGQVIRYDMSSGQTTELTSFYRVLSDFRGDSLLVRKNSGDQIYSYNPVAGGLRKLSNSFFDSVSGFLDELDWDPESDLIALSGRDSGIAHFYIALVSPDGTIVHKVTSGVHFDWRPRFGPTGYLLFDRYNDPHDAVLKEAERIMILKISTGTTTEFLGPQDIATALGVGAIDFLPFKEEQ